MWSIPATTASWCFPRAAWGRMRRQSAYSEKMNAQGLYNPVGIVVDSAGNLFVADAGNGRVLRFPKPFDQPRPNFPSADLVLGQSSFTATKVVDPTQRTMRSPYGLAFTSDG